MLWVACFALTVLVMGWVTRQESDHRLEQESEQFALRWSKQLGRAVPGLAQVFQDGRAAPAVQAEIARLQADADVFHLRLFGIDGRLVLESTSTAAHASHDLLRHVDPAEERPVRIDPADLRALVLSGLARTVLHRGGADPEVFSEVWVPLLQDGRVLGLAQMLVDQSARAANDTGGLIRIASVVTLLLVLIAATATYQHLAARKTRREAEAQVRYLADFDVLTGVLNRVKFHAVLAEAVEQARRHGRGFCLLRIDLDRFKDLNDALGRAAGDELLRVTAVRLKACLLPDDVLARLEGDEFAILLKDAATLKAVEPFVKKVLKAVAEPNMLAGREVRCSGTAGIALFGVDGRKPDDLMTKTDLALFRAKASGRGGYAFHDASLDRQMQSRRELARDLRSAVTDRQLAVYYQPLFAADGQELVGYESLLRWSHPDRGLVPPAEFVPLAEDAGLIDEIGQWVLRQACSDARQWPAPLSVAVNLSATQFASGTLVRQVSRALADSGLEPERLGLEITESLLLHNSDQVMQTLRDLGALGVSIAMDDFGTGYSSLAYLWRFPFDKVKVDQVFTRNMVKDPKVAMIVRSIITLAHSLNMRVNAEGIEHPEQMAALQALGCDELQGFMLGRPAPHDALTHTGYRSGRAPSRPRGEARESLFAALHLDLPSGSGAL